MARHNELGKWGEEIAAKYLIKHGYSIKERNWHLGTRDVDIIAITEDSKTIVFVEVKTREQDEIMDPADAVDRKKVKSIGYCANMYIKDCNLDMDIRFDIITIVGNERSDAPKITHIEDAFNPCLA